jgi:hypothetical protein
MVCSKLPHITQKDLRNYFQLPYKMHKNTATRANKNIQIRKHATYFKPLKKTAKETQFS